MKTVSKIIVLIIIFLNAFFTVTTDISHAEELKPKSFRPNMSQGTHTPLSISEYTQSLPVILTIALPPKHHQNLDAPSDIEILSGSRVIIAEKLTTLSWKGDINPTNIKDSLTVRSSIFYCGDETGSLCKMASIESSAPIVRSDSGDKKMVISFTIKE